MKMLVNNLAQLPELNRQAWLEKAENLSALSHGNPSAIIDAAKLAEIYLTDEIKKLLEKIQQPNGLSFAKITNLPIDSHLLLDHSGQNNFVCEAILTGIASTCHLKPLSYQEEKANHVIHKFSPNHNPSYASEYVMVLSLNNDTPIEIYFADFHEAIGKLSSHCKSILSSPRFQFQFQDSQGEIISSPWKNLITTLPNGKIEITGDFSLVKAKDIESQTALYALISSLHDVIQKESLTRGELFIYNKRRSWFWTGCCYRKVSNAPFVCAAFAEATKDL